MTLYSPCNILITGAAGFIGSNVLLHLFERYPTYRFVCLDRLDSCATLNNLKDVLTSERFQFVKGDINSRDLVSHILGEHKIDTVMHFAACSWVDASFGNSIGFTESNILGTHNLLECCKHLGKQIRRFIHVSTDECYAQVEPNSDHLCSEDSILEPQNPYAATKCAAEYIVKSYFHSFQFPVIITRSSNVIGPRQFVEKFIPKCITLLMRNRPCFIHGTGEHRRSYIYIDDVSAAFDLILHQGRTGETYNIGNEDEISNLDALKTLIRLFHQKYPSSLYHVRTEEQLIEFTEDRLINDFRYRISSEKLKALGWSRKTTSFVDMFQKTMDWYIQNPEHWSNIEFALKAHPFKEMNQSVSK